MAGKIFINYRRDDSGGTAGRLHDRLAQTFGRKHLFMDVDHVPAGVDFVEHLNSQVAACDVFLAIIGPNWLDAKDDDGRRRFDNPDDFVTIEIAAALARNIRVIPVLVDGARTPKADKLPDSIKPLVRRNAVEVRNTNFGRDAEALASKVREALKDAPAVPRRWPLMTSAAAWLMVPRRWRTVAVTATALLLVGWIGLYQTGVPVWVPWSPRTEQLDPPRADKAKASADAEAQHKAEEAEQQRLAAAKAEEERKAKASADAEAQHKAEEAEQQRLAAAKAEEERKAKASADAEAQHKAEEAEQQRLAAAKAEEERKAKASAEAEAQRKVEEAEQQRLAAAKAEEERKAKASAEAEAQRKVEEAEQQRLAAAKAEEERKAEEAERQRLAAAKAEEERKATKAAAEAEAKRKAEEAEQQRLAAAKAEEERRRQAQVEAGARYTALLIQANTDLRNRDHDGAIAALSEAIRLNPNFATAFSDRGVAYERKGDLDRASADFNEAIRLDPTKANTFLNRGITYKRKGDLDRAIADFNEAIRLDPKSALAFTNRGFAYANKGDDDRAIADFNEAIRLDPNYAVAFGNRGTAYANKGDNDRAIADYNEAIRLNPKSAPTFYNRGLAYAGKSDDDRAIADYTEVIRLDPEHAFAFRNRAVSYSRKLDLERASADYIEALRLDPRNNEFLGRAFLMVLANGKVDKAIELAERVLLVDKNDRIARLVLGVRAIKQKQYPLARRELAQSIGGAITDLAATLLSAWTMASPNEAKQATDSIDKLTGADWYAIFKDLHAALILDLTGQKTEAANRFERSYKLDPTALRVVQSYGSFLSRQGSTDKALKVFAAFDEARPRHPLIVEATNELKAGKKLPLMVDTPQAGAAEVLYELGAALAPRGGEDLGLIYLQLALYLSPNHPLAPLSLAQLYEGLKTRARAQ